MKNKTTKTPKKKKQAKPPSYIEVNGFVYERLDSNSQDVEIELEEDVLVKLDGLVSSGEYVSRGDAVRDILRQMIREKSEE
jgi:hypothetical protein